MMVRDALVPDPRVIDGGAALKEVAELLSRPNVRSALVVSDGRLLGCVTATEIVAAVARGSIDGLSARDVASSDHATIGPDASLDDAIHLMAERELDRLPVVADGRLLGVLPREGLVRRLAEDEAPDAVAET
jgi:CBS domain-containing protein